MAKKKSRRAAAAPADPRIPDLMHAATARYQAGQPEVAEDLCRQVLALRPNQPEALHLQGLICHGRGEPDAAARWLRRAAASAPGAALPAFQLGELLREQGRAEAALRAYDQALAADDQLADAHFARGSLLLELGRPVPAAEALERAVTVAPRDREAWNNLGNARDALGRTRQAVAAYRRALDLDPGYRDARENLARCLLDWGRWDEAAAEARRLEQDQPGETGPASLLAEALARSGDLAGARQVLERCRGRASSAALAARLGGLLEQEGRLAEAAQVYRDAAGAYPDATAGLLAGAGAALEQLGDAEGAADAYRQALGSDADCARALEGLSRTAPSDLETQTPRLADLAGDRRRGLDERAAAAFALARLAERGGDPDQAFARYREANRLLARRRPFDSKALTRATDQIIETFNAAWLARQAREPEAPHRSVLIVGMPRSGTTLLEQILAAHPAVAAGGERDDFQLIAGALGGWLEQDGQFPAVAAQLDLATAQALEAHYRQRLESAFPGGALVTDKLPSNYLRLGLVAAVAPGTRVVHLGRDPMDTGLSCYFTHFGRGQSFACDLAHIGHAYREYVRLMDHWRAVRPLPMLELTYEDLVANPEARARELLEFLDLPWDPACLDFHRRDAAVRTASLWQVRQPLYASSVGRWRRYARHLEPLRRALGDLAPG